MKYRKGVSAIVFRGNKFLILKRKLNWIGWEILKGGKKGNEPDERAMCRELREETGIRRCKCTKTSYNYKYPWKKSYVKDKNTFDGAHFRLFLIENLDKTDKIKIDKLEHSAYKWATAKTALKMITYSDQRKAFRFALRNYFG
jgi:8-oxo-dGTP pyrophosphatase MutT (NUDIX family)